MNVTGIVAEFNPLHKGHIRLLQYAKQNLGDSFVIVAMSGDFMQRGIPAMIDKYERARLALHHGADLVIELPVTGATSSAEDFARCGVMTLHATGMIRHLLFGSEHPVMDYFYEAAKLDNDNSVDFYKHVNELVRSGMSYAAAREQAMTEKNEHSFPAEFLSGSNNILGVEYVKAIQHFGLPVKPVTIGRDGGAYNSMHLQENGTSSATAIRHAIHTGNAKAAAGSMPPDVIDSLRAALSAHEIIRDNDLSQLLHHALIMEDDFSCYADVSEDLSHKITAARDRYTGFTEFALALKSKDITYTHICRGLLHILLSITDDDISALKSVSYAPYLRILGFTKRGTALLKQMKECAEVPFFVSPKEADGQLSPTSAALLERDGYAADLYRVMLTSKTARSYPTELTRLHTPVA